MNWDYIIDETFQNFALFVSMVLAFGVAFFYAGKIKENQSGKLKWFVILFEIFGGILFGAFGAVAILVDGSNRERQVIYFITFVVPGIIGAIWKLGKKDE